MNKQIKFEYNGEKYTLEYNRESIQIMEQQGFSVNELTTKPMTMLPLAFQGLFYKNHRKAKKAFIEECFDKFKDKQKLLSTISEMLLEAYETLTDNEGDENEGNLNWEIVG